MSDLFFLNELEKSDSKPKTSYANDNSHLSSVSIFIKALNRASDKIDEAITIIPKIKNLHGTANERDEEDSKLLVNFVESIDLAGKILDEFQKGTSILNDNTPEVVQIFTELNNEFGIARIKLNLFSITKDLKYGAETKETIANILKLFETMKEVILEGEVK
jgi:hypothetical protein